MGKCPECGGEMIGHMKRKICETCGLSLTATEYDKAWDKIHDSVHDDDNTRSNKNREYLKWYESKKEK